MPRPYRNSEGYPAADRPACADVQRQADRLMHVVLDAVSTLTPKAKPSPYAKRWWTRDLTKLRRVYTYWRNRARAQRRAGEALSELEQQARAAAKEYHDAIRKQQRLHWDEFLAEDTNIWKATRYLKPDDGSGWTKIPPLQKADGHSGRGRPTTKAACPHARADREDGLPAGVWKQIWPAVRESVRRLFQTSLDTGVIPKQWKVAKIIPLKKPNKDDYTLAKAWRPISLLSTLGKLLEAVIAERLSFAVETYGLLPANHFGARKQRSAEQALLLLQECIYTAWRNKRVVSLVSFDVKGAYNGVYKDRLLQRLAARGIPSDLVKWIDAFCSERTATIVVNGQASEVRGLEQAGLPQGSPLSPILFLFFNADLVQQRIDQNGGAIAFVDDYTAWVVGATAAGNMDRLNTIVQRATAWESRSGASFEGDKTAFIHFTRNSRQFADEPISVKGEEVRPTASVKILGLIMDSRLRYQEHTARAATRGLQAAMALKRLRGLSPSVSRKLFNATVAPVVDYASSVWTHARRASAERWSVAFRRSAQRTTLTKSAEDMIRRRACKRYTSPLQKIAESARGAPMDDLEATQPYISAPWDARLDIANSADDGEQAAGCAQVVQGIRVATSASARNRLVGIGGAIDGIDWIRNNSERCEYDKTVGTNAQSDAYTAALASIEVGLGLVVSAVYDNTLSARVRGQVTHVFTNNRTVLVTLRNGTRRSGQWIISGILKHVRRLKESHNRVVFAWAPVSSAFELGQKAKQLAQRSTDEKRVVKGRPRLTRSMVQKTQERLKRVTEQVPAAVGASLRRIDTAWPGTHTRRMYDDLTKRQASILAQLRTGMTPLNGYLHNIKAVESNLCECGEAVESREHFVLRCARWSGQRKILGVYADEDNFSRLLGGKSAMDTDDWSPDMNAVRAVIHFTLATKRFEHDSNDRDDEHLETQLQEHPPTSNHEHTKTRDSTHCSEGLSVMADNGHEFCFVHLIVVYVLSAGRNKFIIIIMMIPHTAYLPDRLHLRINQSVGQEYLLLNVLLRPSELFYVEDVPVASCDWAAVSEALARAELAMRPIPKSHNDGHSEYQRRVLYTHHPGILLRRTLYVENWWLLSAYHTLVFQVGYYIQSLPRECRECKGMILRTMLLIRK
ncbi:hypothetical protein KC353_g1 [Hortaea werneckii]|nr:hypothetical protein KC353_g1 [Hortaea werneckii]